MVAFDVDEWPGVNLNSNESSSSSPERGGCGTRLVLEDGVAFAVVVDDVCAGEVVAEVVTSECRPFFFVPFLGSL